MYYHMQICGTGHYDEYLMDRPLEEYGFSFVRVSGEGTRIWEKWSNFYVECDNG